MAFQICEDAPRARRLCLMLWRVTFVFSRRLFLRLLGITYLIAFASLGVQMTGLVGSRGILPIADFLRAVRAARSVRTRITSFPRCSGCRAATRRSMFLCWGGAALSLRPDCGLRAGCRLPRCCGCSICR